MGLFGFLEDAAEVVTRTVTLPMTVVADAVTLGGVLTGKNGSYTGRQLKRIVDKTSDAVDEIVD